MKANELRIGNYLYDNEVGHKGSFKVSAEDILDIYKHGIETDYSTIPLTEEWLLKFGFAQAYKNPPEVYRKKIFNDIYLTVDLYENLNNVYLGKQGIYHIKHVHQLQNLYFALTNEQLRIT